jgi:hypothetical protein
MCRKLNSEFDPVTFSCQKLWRHDACQQFYKVFNYFVSVFKALIFGRYFPRFSGQPTIFLDRKGTVEEMENYNVIRIFGSKQNPCFLPCHISGTMFFAGITREYIYWLHFFHEKRKGQFISMPWKVWDFMVRNHFNSSFTYTILNGLCTSTNDSHKQNRKDPGEKSAQSPTATTKTTTSRGSTPTTYPSNKVTHSSSGGGGDKNPPFGKIESCHKLPAGKKWKTIVQEQEGPRGEIDIYDLSLEDMELEIDIEKMFPDDDHLESTAPHNPGMEIIGIDTLDEEESFAFQSVVFDSESKKLIIENKDVKNKKGTSRSEFNLRNMRPSQISKMHRATGDALDNSISGLEMKNLMLKT